MQRSCVKISNSNFWNSQISFQFLHCQLSIFVGCSPYTFNILKCSACCRPSRMWITFNKFSTIFTALVPHFYLCCTHWIVPKSLLNHPNSFQRRMFKLKAKFDMQICCIYSLSHFDVIATQYTCSFNGVYHPTNWYSEVTTVHAYVCHSTVLGCQVTLMLHKLFWLY